MIASYNRYVWSKDNVILYDYLRPGRKQNCVYANADIIADENVSPSFSTGMSSYPDILPACTKQTPSIWDCN